MKRKITLIVAMTLAIFAGNAQQTFTLGHDPLGAHNFNLYGALNTGGNAATYSFVYSADSTFATSSSTPVQNLNNNQFNVVWATVNNLTANTNYYYYLTATAGGTTNGEHMHFYSDTISPIFENLGADVYGNSYAEMNGKVDGFSGTWNLSFEYGLTPALGLTTSSNYAVVSDANSHTFRGTPSPLTSNALYFFRVKASNATDSIYSDIRAFDLSNPYTTVQALPATGVTATGATLNGTVQGFPVPVKINSEINGAGFSHVHTALDYHDYTSALINYSYNVTGAQPNQYYQVRFKVDTWVGDFYGDTAFTTLFTGIDETSNTESNTFTFPNPANNFLTLELANGFNSETAVQLVNISGQVVQELKIPSNQTMTIIDVTDLESGVYVMKFVSGSAAFTKKITIVK